MLNRIVKFLAVGFVILAARLPEKQALVLQHTSLEPASGVPAAVQIIPPLLQDDLNLDGTPDCLALKDGKAIIQGSACGNPEEALWESPQAWHITQAAVGDLNWNGIPEVALLVWRPFKPWPVDRFLVHPGRIETHQNSAGESCHIILIEYEPGSGQFEESWAGSALVRPLNDFRVIDLDNDSKQELVALETSYDASAITSNNLSVWEWSGFGFQLVTRKEGRFYSLNAGSMDDGQPAVQVEGNLKDGQ
jgi:hypothetical protein